MAQVAAMAIPAIIGAVGAYDSSKRQSSTARDAARPRPFWQQTYDRPRDYMDPLIQDAIYGANTNYLRERDDPRLPPTFNDVMTGRYGSALPSSALGGIHPSAPSRGMRQAWNAALERAQEKDREAGRDPRESLTPRERQKIAERYNARQQSRGGGSAPTGGQRSGRRGGGGFGGGFGGGGGGGGGGNARVEFQDYLVDRAKRPVPGQQGALDFISSLFSGATPAAAQQQQTYDDFRSPDNPLNQLIAKGMGEGFSSAAPMQQQLFGNIYGRMNAPPAELPQQRFQSFFDLAGPESDFRLFDI